jgi:Asp-tRNA(Asn)/Glu-tRNA(Gln) amidotransferase A subunit family amidase
MSTEAPLWQPWSLRALVEDLRTGVSRPAEALVQAEARITSTEPYIRAWVERFAPAPFDRRGPLAGVPLGVKDIIDVAGWPTRCGSSLRAGAAPASADAAIVAAWRATGAVPIGKTVTTEFAFFFPGATRNPAALECTPGGSSSGSAAAVAAGQVPLAIGSQTAGSVTRPAAYCGVASLVLSHGRYPLDGITGLSPSLDSHGIYAAGTSDLALAWSALSGEPDVGSKPGWLAPPRVLLWSAGPLGIVSEEMAAALECLEAVLTAQGAAVDAFPEESLIAEITEAHPVVMAYEAARTRAAELALSDCLSEPFAKLLRTGAATADADYRAAKELISRARQLLAPLLSSYDAILGPAAPGSAPAGLAATGDPALSRPWQSIGLPALAIPGLRNGSGLPLGVQAIAGAGAETQLLALGMWVEQALIDRCDLDRDPVL